MRKQIDDNEISADDLQIKLAKVNSKKSETLTATLSKRSNSQSMLKEESKHGKDSFKYDMQNTSDEDGDEDEDDERSDQTISTQKRARRKANLIEKREREVLLAYRKEPERPANS